MVNCRLIERLVYLNRYVSYAVNPKNNFFNQWRKLSFHTKERDLYLFGLLWKFNIEANRFLRVVLDLETTEMDEIEACDRFEEVYSLLLEYEEPISLLLVYCSVVYECRL